MANSYVRWDGSYFGHGEEDIKIESHRSAMATFKEKSGSEKDNYFNEVIKPRLLIPMSINKPIRRDESFRAPILRWL
jgi:hypothetical protein